jgi:hypothetical protein
MITLNLDDIQNFLVQEQFKSQIQKETHQIYLLYKIEGREFPLFLRIFPGGDLLQLIAFIPCHLKAATFGDLGRLLHLINKEMDIPGFGMDEEANLIFYRVMMPSVEKQVHGNHLKRFIQSIEQILKNFGPLIALVAFGGTSFEEIRKKIKPHQPKHP